MNVIDTREIFSRNGLMLTVDMIPDPHHEPQDHDESEAITAAWKDGRWWYVAMGCVVSFRGVELSRNLLSGIMHGDISDGDAHHVDAWDMTGPLGDVVAEALSNAIKWLNGATAANVASLLDAADQWATAESEQSASTP